MSFKTRTPLYSASQYTHGEGFSKRRRLSSASADLSSAPRSFSSDVSDGCLTPPRELESSVPYATGAELDKQGSAVASSSRLASRATVQARAAQSHDSAMYRSTRSRSARDMEDEQVQLQGTSSSSASLIGTRHSSDGDGDSEPAGVVDREPAAAQSQPGNGSSTARKTIAGIRSATLEYDLALIRFAAHDAVLRGFMTTGAATGVMASLERFYKLKGGSKSNSVYVKVHRWRGRYAELSTRLSAAARTTPTAAWSEENLGCLRRFEERDINKVFMALHDEIYAVATHGSTDAASPAPVQPEGDITAPLKLNLESTSAISTKPRRLNRHEETQHDTMQAQLDEQSLQIAQLRSQNETQAELIRQQGELLRRHVTRAELRVEREDARFEQQAYRLERIEKHLETLLASQEHSR